jgi:tripartite-type tricarboxylate transporter receptor subunit TctC
VASAYRELAPVLLVAHEGLDMVAVPYQSMPSAISALVAGTVQMFFDNITDAIESIRSGTFRVLAVSAEQRVPTFPDVPTVAETVPGFSMIGWHGVLVPAGTPQRIVARLSKALDDIRRDTEFIKILANVGIDTAGGAPDDLARAI